jgi:hypothetical protein
VIGSIDRCAGFAQNILTILRASRVRRNRNDRRSDNRGWFDDGFLVRVSLRHVVAVMFTTLYAGLCAIVIEHGQVSAVAIADHAIVALAVAADMNAFAGCQLKGEDRPEEAAKTLAEQSPDWWQTKLIKASDLCDQQFPTLNMLFPGSSQRE